MVADYDISKELDELGFHCKSFWVYIGGKKTYTGMDGYDEGQFEFLEDNFIDPKTKEGMERLEINKGWVDEAYPQNRPEVVVAPEQEDILLWLDSLGYYVTVDHMGAGTWGYTMSCNNFSVHCNRGSRLEATHDGIMEAINHLKRYTRK